MCDNLFTVSIIPIDTNEEMIMNPFPPPLDTWRYYRLEYGGHAQDCLWEGRILLPGTADPDAVVSLIMGMEVQSKLWVPCEPLQPL